MEQKLSLQMRWMIRRDMPDVMRIEGQGALNHASFNGKFYTNEWDEERFLAFLRQRNCIGIVAEHDNEVAGFIVYMLYGKYLTILNTGVSKAYGEKHTQDIMNHMLDNMVAKLDQQRRIALLCQVFEYDQRLIELLSSSTIGEGWQMKVLPDGIIRERRDGQGVWRFYTFAYVLGDDGKTHPFFQKNPEGPLPAAPALRSIITSIDSTPDMPPASDEPNPPLPDYLATCFYKDVLVSDATPGQMAKLPDLPEHPLPERLPSAAKEKKGTASRISRLRELTGIEWFYAADSADSVGAKQETSAKKPFIPRQVCCIIPSSINAENAGRKLAIFLRKQYPNPDLKLSREPAPGYSEIAEENHHSWQTRLLFPVEWLTKDILKPSDSNQHFLNELKKAFDLTVANPLPPLLAPDTTTYDYEAAGYEFSKLFDDSSLSPPEDPVSEFVVSRDTIIGNFLRSVRESSDGNINWWLDKESNMISCGAVLEPEQAASLLHMFFQKKFGVEIGENREVRFPADWINEDSGTYFPRQVAHLLSHFRQQELPEIDLRQGYQSIHFSIIAKPEGGFILSAPEDGIRTEISGQDTSHLEALRRLVLADQTRRPEEKLSGTNAMTRFAIEIANLGQHRDNRTGRQQQ